MKSIARTLLVAASAAAILIFQSCEKPAPEVPKEPEEEKDPSTVTPEKEPIGTYMYDGKTFPVHSIVYAANANSIMVKISPLDRTDNQTTYAVIGINSGLEDMDIDVAKAWHNDDYYFIYEDPLKYYSQYRELSSGTIRISKTGEEFIVKADLTLPDGIKFQFDYEGLILCI